MADQPSMNTIPESFAALQTAFLPAKAVGVDKTIQFDYSGAEPGTWTLHVHDGKVDYHQGPAEAPNATVSVDSENWLALLRGELNPMTAYMSGKIKIKGDITLLMQFQQWFAR